jgi:hypothetical protein
VQATAAERQGVGKKIAEGNMQGKKEKEKRGMPFGQ